MGVKKNVVKRVLLHMEAILFFLLPINKNKIVISNFWGSSYDGNPKYITEQLLKEGRLYELVWLVSDYKEEIPKNVRQVKYGSFRAYYELATAHMWIDSIRNSYKGMKKKKQVYLQTWHGAFELKLIEKQTENSLKKAYVKKAKHDGKITDGIIACSGKQSQNFKNYFWLNDKTEILEVGLPRNDIFFDDEYGKKIRKKICKYFDISESCKIIIYMPTFRDNNRNEAYEFDYMKIIDTFQEKFDVSCRLIIRLHPNAKDYAASITYNSQILNGSLYDDSEELCIASDYMITDYSSCFYEFVLLRRPIFLFTKDYAEYKNGRGLNKEYDKLPFPRADSEQDLIHKILQFDEDEYLEKINSFAKSINSYDDGNASIRVSKWISDKMRMN